MLKALRIAVALALGAAAICPQLASAQELAPERPSLFFVELTGSYGLQIGNADYIPSGALDDYKFPWVYGHAVGATGGITIAEGVDAIANYEYTSAQSIEGEVPMVLDSIEGEIDYHSLVVGLRLRRQLGFGRLRAEVAAGIAFPHETELELEYGPALSMLPEPITGTGRRVENFNTGYGGHGLLGYEIPVTRFSYVALSFKLKAFQSNNREEVTELDNFVVDFEEEPPAAVTADIDHGDAAAQPHTEAIADARVQAAIGVRF